MQPFRIYSPICSSKLSGLLISFYFFAYSFIWLLFHLLFQFHRLSATVHITDTACSAAVICTLTYYFKFKPASFTNKSLTSFQIIAIHSIPPRYMTEKVCYLGSSYLRNNNSDDLSENLSVSLNQKERRIKRKRKDKKDRWTGKKEIVRKQGF